MGKRRVSQRPQPGARNQGLAGRKVKTPVAMIEPTPIMHSASAVRGFFRWPSPSIWARAGRGSAGRCGASAASSRLAVVGKRLADCAPPERHRPQLARQQVQLVEHVGRGAPAGGRGGRVVRACPSATHTKRAACLQNAPRGATRHASSNEPVPNIDLAMARCERCQGGKEEGGGGRQSQGQRGGLRGGQAACDAGACRAAFTMLLRGPQAAAACGGGSAGGTRRGCGSGLRVGGRRRRASRAGGGHARRGGGIAARRAAAVVRPGCSRG